MRTRVGARCALRVYVKSSYMAERDSPLCVPAHAHVIMTLHYTLVATHATLLRGARSLCPALQLVGAMLA